MSIAYTSDAHEARFHATMDRIGKIYNGKPDPEYGAAIYILTSSLALWHKCSADVAQDGIGIGAMLEDTDFSGGQEVLVRLAGNLFNGQHHVEPLDLLRLDETNFAVALEAIKLRRE